MHVQVHTQRAIAGGKVRIDTARRRVWIGDQRLHHGLTGVVLAAAGLVLMAHDWHDRSVWFRRGSQL